MASLRVISNILGWPIRMWLPILKCQQCFQGKGLGVEQQTDEDL